MYKAIKTFAGNVIAMKKGDIKEYIDQKIAEDLLRAGYIEEVKEEVEPVVAEEQKEEVVEVKEVEKPKRTTTKRNKVQK